MTTRGILFASVLLATLTPHGFAQTPTPPGTLVLDKGWGTPIQGGSATMELILFNVRATNK